MGFVSTGGADPDNVSLENNVSGKMQIKDGGVDDSHFAIPYGIIIVKNSMDIFKNLVENSITPIDQDSLLVETASDIDGFGGTYVLDGTTNIEYDSINKKFIRTTKKYYDDFDRTSGINGWSNDASPTVTIEGNALKQDMSTGYGFSVFTFDSNETPTKILMKFKRDTLARDGSVYIKDTAGNRLVGFRLTTANETHFYTGNGSKSCGVAAGTSYHTFELRNINWVAGTYDCYLNDVLKFTGETFLDSPTEINEIHCGTAGTNTDFSTYLDEFYLECGDGVRNIKIDVSDSAGSLTAHQFVLSCPERESGDAITYDVYDTDANHDDGFTVSSDNIAYSAKNVFTNVDPLKLDYILVHLTPKGTSPTSGYPSMQSSCFKKW